MTCAALCRRRSSREAGFTVIEMLTAGFLLLLVLLGVLALFEMNSKLARAQTQVAGMQQSIRVAQADMIRLVRMAGRGELPRGALPQGVAVGVRNNAPASGDRHHIAVGDTDTEEVLAGTDVLTVRGVFSTPIYQVVVSPSSFSLDDQAAPTQGTVRIQNPFPGSGIQQDLTPLIEAAQDDRSEALLLVGPLGDVAVVAIDPSVGGHSAAAGADDIRIGFNIGTVGGSSRVDRYATLGGGFPIGLRTVSQVGILEEVRFYVREDHAVSGAPSSDLTPSLSRARLFPGTETAHPDNPGLADDIADNVFDLQVAFGVDTDNDEVILDDGTQNDDWLYNSPDDADSNGVPANPAEWNGAGGNRPSLYYLRITTLARTDRRDLGYEAPLLGQVEDKDYTVKPFDDFNTRTERMFRRRQLRTVVDMRNVS